MIGSSLGGGRRFEGSPQSRHWLAARLDETNEAILDYYLLPALDMTWRHLRLAEENGIYLDAYQFQTLDYFYRMTERCRVEEAA